MQSVGHGSQWEEHPARSLPGGPVSVLPRPSLPDLSLGPEPGGLLLHREKETHSVTVPVQGGWEAGVDVPGKALGSVPQDLAACAEDPVGTVTTPQAGESSFRQAQVPTPHAGCLPEPMSCPCPRPRPGGGLAAAPRSDPSLGRLLPPHKP